MTCDFDSHRPRVLIWIVVDDRSENHELCTSAFEERDLVFLAHVDEGRDLLGHTDDPLDGQVGQVDHTHKIVGFVLKNRNHKKHTSITRTSGGRSIHRFIQCCKHKTCYDL